MPPGYTPKRISMMILRLLSEFCAAVQTLGGRVFYAKFCNTMDHCLEVHLLFTLFKNYLIKQGVKEDHIIGVNLENRLNKSLRDPDALLQYIDSRLSSDGQYYVMLDEVQMVSEFEDVLNSFLSISNVDK